MKTIYFIRHSMALRYDNKDEVIHLDNPDYNSLRNEKNVLSVEGEELAKDKMNNPELKNLDYVISSNYVRAVSTAKYLASYNNLPINIVSGFGEREFGKWEEGVTGEEFGRRQFYDPTYKFEGGECQEDVLKRYRKAFDKIFELDGNRIAVVSHGTALSFFLKSLTKTEFIDSKVIVEFNGKEVFNDKMYNCVIFKMIFDDNKELVDISVVR